jgi:hypothetical protein
MLIRPILLSMHLMATSLAWSASYFIDSRNGSDSNDGGTPATAWKSLSKVGARALKPGDVVNIQSGSTFTEGLTLDDSGIKGSPITFKGIGDGAKPLFSGNGISITGDWVVVEGLKIASVFKEAINIRSGAIHNIVRACEIVDCGAGVWVSGTDNLVTGNYIHDLHIVKSTPGGDDDNGAVGVWMGASRVEVSYNTFVNCKDSSLDYVYDGGAVEWWAQSNLDSCYVHHNFATGSEGFLESGGRGATISNARVAYNVSVNNGWFALLNTTGQYAVKLKNFQMNNNTVVQTGPHEGWGATRAIYFFDPSLDMSASVSVVNNIFYLDGWNVCDNATITHNHNLFYFPANRGKAGFALDATDRIGDPLFTNLADGNFQLSAGSPAIDMGIRLGYSTDFPGNPVSFGTAPDAGAYEYQGKIVSILRDGSPGTEASQGVLSFEKGRLLFRQQGRLYPRDAMGRKPVR